MSGAALLATLPVATASAAVICSYDAASAVVTVTLDAGDSTTISRNGTAIEVGGVACDSADVTNTDSIQISGAAGFGTVTISLAGGQFAPGKTAEAKGASEIEFTVDAGGAAGSVQVQGSNAHDVLVFGAQKINLNGSETPADVDVSLSAGAAIGGADAGLGPDLISLRLGTGAAGGNYLGGAGKDDFLANANGGASFDGGVERDTVDYFENPSPIRYSPGMVETGAGFDTLVSVEHIIGSTMADRFLGGSDDEILEGRGGADVFLPAGGNDVVRGGAGKRDLLRYDTQTSIVFNLVAKRAAGLGIDQFENVERLAGGAGDDSFRDPWKRTQTFNGRAGYDTVNYSTAPSGVFVSLADNTPDAPKVDVLLGIEKVIGSRYHDVVIGDAKDNFLSGGNGDDRLLGMAGNDTLIGAAGNDFLDGGPGNDSCAPGQGDDIVKRCEV
jgi:Ca2+-binding RTX toxin-like protein